MKTIVWFKMTAKSEAERVIFNGEPSYNEIDEYFENACGGVYKWWIQNNLYSKYGHQGGSIPQNNYGSVRSGHVGSTPTPYF